jgi:hypothetical protein
MSSRPTVLHLLALAGLAACAGPGGAAAPAATSSAAGAWQEPGDYSFTVRSSCGERSFLGVHHVVVAGGEVAESEWLDPATGVWTSVDSLESVPTLGDLLAEVEQASGDPEAGEVVLESDPVDGHPTVIRVDHIENAIDDESCYEITEYEPAG